jgi:2-polyprenyl-6-methoxyphenol hydroxylase-like FAD-dependent oxidoreductase
MPGFGSTPSVTVVGAGPAGSFAATLLARAGFHVHLIEQARFPRDKVCGECLSAPGWEALVRYGLAAGVRDNGAVELHRCICHAPTGERGELKLPAPMIGISRARLDARLLDAAIEAGASVHQPARCDAVHEDGTVHVCAHNGAQPSVIKADFVLVADGKGRLLRPNHALTGDFGIKAHFSGVAAPRDAIQLFGVRESYGGIAPIEHGAFNASFSVPHPRLRACQGNLDRLCHDLCRENRSLGNAMKSATRTSPWLSCPLPRFVMTTPLTGRVIPIGNAFAAIEPIGGEGMGLAIRSAEIVADALTAARDDGRAIDLNALSTEFHRLWSRTGLTCRAMAKVMSDGLSASTLITLAGDSASLKRLSLWLVGK